MTLDVDIQSESEAIALKLEGDPDLSGPLSAHELLARISNGRNVVLAALFRALGAQRRVFEKGSSEPHLEPDHRTQVEAAKLILAYSDGIPPQTNLNVQVPARRPKERETTLNEAMNSAAVRAAVRDLLDEAEKDHLT